MTFLAVAAVAAAVAWTPLWHGFRLVVTFLHEMGHAVMAGVVGGGVRRVVVRLDSSGHTEWFAPRGRFRLVLVAGSGYTAPAAAAVACAVSVQQRHAGLFSLVSAAIAALVIVGWVRHLFTLMLIVACAGLLVVTWHYNLADYTQSALAGSLSAGALRAAREQHLQRDVPGSDVGHLRAATKLPAGVFSWGFMLVAVVSVVAVTVVLLMDRVPV